MGGHGIYRIEKIIEEDEWMATEYFIADQQEDRWRPS
jgi:hypothetical protein